MDYLTQEKFDEFQKELEHLKTVKRTEIAAELEYAKSLGDLSENAEYHEARNEQAVVEDRINHLEALLRNASIVSSHGTDSVAVGTTITLERSKDSTKKVFTIVGSEESDAASGKISVRSPIGSAALNKKKGESFSVDTPTGAVTWKVLAIQ